MQIDILTLFPQMFEGPLSSGIFKRAADRNLVRVRTHNFREFAHDRHHTVDDYSYGGGAGMVLKPEPIFECVEAVKAEIQEKERNVAVPIILLTPQGRLFSQQVARELSRQNHLIIICGHYEGFDERVVEYLATDEISIGDYVLSGGEPAALVVSDAVIRLIPGVLGSPLSTIEESHAAGLLEYPQYTRPPVYRGWKVPDVLVSGNHGEVARWQREQAILRTLKRRPDLLEKADLTVEERQLVEKLRAKIDKQHGVSLDEHSRCI